MLKEHKCRTCGRSFTGGPRAYYCPSCRAERQKVANREHKRNKRLGLTRELGSLDKCDRCGKDYVVEAGLQRFCPDCQIEHALEYDRKTSIEFYHGNKKEINPSRNKKRRVGIHKCTWCGKEYEKNNSQLTCSDECRRLLRNKKWVDKYHKNKAPLN